MPPATNTSTFMPPPNLDERSEEQLSEGPSVGTQLAITVGSVLATGLLAILWLYLRRWWRRKAQRRYAQADTTEDAEDELKPYIITPYIVPPSRSNSTEPHERSHSPGPELEVLVLPYGPLPPSHSTSTLDADDHEPDTWATIDISEQEKHECATSPAVPSASYLTSPTPADALRQITSPTPSIALEPTRLSGEYSQTRTPVHTSGLALASAGIAFVTSELKEITKQKRKRKSKILSVPRSKSFRIDRGRTPGHSPTSLEEVPPPLPSSLSPLEPLPVPFRISR